MVSVSIHTILYNFRDVFVYSKQRSAFPSSIPNKTRLDETGDHSRIAGTGTGLLLYGPVARENSGKIREKFRTGRDYSVPLGKSFGWS